MSLAQPLMVEPSGLFDGIDGNWSSFQIRVGTLASNVRVLVSTLVPETWVVLPAGCTYNDPPTCYSARGGLFDTSLSSTWVDKKSWTLNEEAVLGIDPATPGNYGYDVLGVQIHDSAGGGITLGNQVIAGIATKSFFLGNLGLAPRRPAFGDSQNPSFLQSLKNQNSIPSLSYGYTAGAFYKNRTASLTLGGYDASRLIPNDVSFTLASIETHDLVVGIQSITFSSSNTADVPLMPYGNGVLAFIDSTLPNLWLPRAVCDAFAQQFGLIFDAVHLLYTVNDTMHDANVKNDVHVTFQLANFITGGNSVNIIFPYASFDLNSTTLATNKTTRYFPLRQADGLVQYTLGRAFLQEAFLSVDYERKVFNVSQVDFSNQPSHIVPIQPFNASETGSGGSSTTSGTTGSTTGVSIVSQSSGLGTGAIAGIAIGIVLLAIVLASAIIFVLWRRKRDRKRRSQANTFELPTEDQKSPTGFVGYFHSFSKFHRDSKHIAATNEYAVEHDGKEVHSLEMFHAAASPVPLTELEGPEVLRAELHSPEPPDVGAVSPQSEKPGMELAMESNQDLPHRVPSSPNISTATPSAFRSPTIGFTGYDDVATPLSPEEAERGGFFLHR